MRWAVVWAGLYGIAGERPMVPGIATPVTTPPNFGITTPSTLSHL